MASRWRTWDQHFATDILDSKLPFEPLDIIAVGGRGKRKFNISPNLLTIPSIAYSQIKPGQKVSGRGRRLKENKDNQSKSNNVSNIISNTEAIYDKYRNAKIENDFPTLQASHKYNNIHHKKPEFLGCPVKSSLKMRENEVVVGQFKDHEGPKYKCSDKNDTFSPNYEQQKESVLSNKNVINSFSMKGEHIGNDYTNQEFLATLTNIECYILIENLSIDADELTFQELISSFGEIDLFLSQLCTDKLHKVALVKMKLSDNCDWVISCLHGDNYVNDRLVARRVDEIIMKNTL